MGIWDWLTDCPVDGEDAVLVGEWAMAQGGGSVAKDVTTGDLGVSQWRRKRGCLVIVMALLAGS